MNSKTPPEIQLHLGPELPENTSSPHARSAIDLKKAMLSRHETAPIQKRRSQEKKKKSFVILSYLSRSRQGLSRLQFVAVALLFVLFLNMTQVFYQGQFKGKESLVSAAEALSNLKTGGVSILGEKSQDEALKSFQEAEFLLEKARKEGSFLLQESSPWVTEPQAVKSYRALLQAGEDVTDLAYHLSALREAMQNIPEQGSLTEFLKKLSQEHVEPAALLVENMDAELAKVDLSGTAYEEKFLEYRSLLKKILPWIETWREVESPLLYALGDKQAQHYAVLFQNPREMRLGGGFIGSFAIVEVNDGRLANMEFHNSYDFANLDVNQVDQPNPEMVATNGKLELQDANFSPDFEKSAKSFMELLENAGGPGLDGVIGLSFETTRSLLALQGDSLEIPETGQRIPLEDLDEYLGVEIKQAEGADSKAGLFDMVERVMNSQMKNSRMRFAWVLKTVQALQAKESVIYHKHNQVLSSLQSFGWTGRLPDFNMLEGDYFMPVMTTLGGTKIEDWIETEWDYEIIRLKDGSRLHRATLNRKNTWTERAWANMKQDLAFWTGKELTRDEAWIFGEGPLQSAWRFYIPEEARWTNLEGVYRDDLQPYYDEYLDHSYYLWQERLEKGESKKIVLEFIVPAESYEEEYEFHFFKQVGKNKVALNFNVKGENGSMVAAEPSLSGEEGLSFWGENSNEGDLHFRSVWQKEWFPF